MKTLYLGAALLALSVGGAAAQQLVRIGTEGAFPPYNFTDEAGEVRGFERELGDELCKRAGLSCEWVKTDWASIIPNLQSGTYDAIMDGMDVTAERDEVIAFTQPYIPPATSAFVALTAEADPKSGPVAVQSATIQATYLAGQALTLAEQATVEDAIDAVRKGAAVAAFADKAILQPVVDKAAGALAFVGEPVELTGGVAIGLRESDAELKVKFDDAIQTMKDDGSLNAMIVTWFGDQAAIFAGADPASAPGP